MKDTTFKKSESGFSLVELLIVSVILVFSIGLITEIVINVQRSYSKQRVRTEAINDADAALDMMTRLIRMAGNNPNRIIGLQAIDPGTTSGGAYRTIRIRSDWRGATTSSFPDGDATDSFEDIKFFVQNNILMKQEPSDTGAVEFLANVFSLQFIYYDTDNVMITDPITNAANITRIDITIFMQPLDSPPMTFTSSAFMRQK